MLTNVTHATTHESEQGDVNLRRGDYGLWMSCQHYTGAGRDELERENNYPSRWPGQRPRYVAADIDALVALCADLPPHQGHPFVARWDGENWRTEGMVWKDGHVEMKGKTRLGKLDRNRRGETKSSYGDSYPPYESIASDEVPTQRVGAEDTPEVEAAFAAIEAVSRPRTHHKQARLTAAENRVIEQHAVTFVRNHLERELHYATEDIGAYESYDIRATKAGCRPLLVEVKGTTSDGSQVVLTANEVRLHNAEYPHTAFAVVSNIRLDKSGSEASGGTMDLKTPWKPDPTRLEAIAYRYRT